MDDALGLKSQSHLLYTLVKFFQIKSLLLLFSFRRMLCKSNLEPQVEILPCSRIGIDPEQPVVPILVYVSSEVKEGSLCFNGLSSTINGIAHGGPNASRPEWQDGAS
jgi:hypothetical protein